MTMQAERAEEPRYTLAEARRILAEQNCDRDGHDLEQLSGPFGVFAVGCSRCPAAFEPPLLPPLPPASELREDTFTAGGHASFRLTHITTGLTAVTEGGVTGRDNKLRAEQVLRARLFIRSLEGGARQAPEVRPPDLPPDSVRYDMVSDGSGHTGGYAIKAIHIPTGVTAVAAIGRSDQQKRDAATALLRARLLVAQLEREANN